MGLLLKIHFQKPGYPLSQQTVDVPVKFLENEEISKLVNGGYYYVSTDVRAYP